MFQPIKDSHVLYRIANNCVTMAQYVVAMCICKFEVKIQVIGISFMFIQTKL